MGIEIHQLRLHDEFAGVVKLQQEIWGFEEVDLLPLRLFVVASKIGGQVLGAFDSRKMVAFCFCIPGLKSGGKAYLHSHMLGVLPEYRNTGLGRKMKLAQRQFALAAGVDLIEWTFDPLEIKNAFFNIERLGVIVRRYVPNQYGSSSSHLHGGLPTDRLVAEWWIGSPRVKSICEDSPYQRPETKVSISVPAEIATLRLHDKPKARHVQAAIGDQFQEYFRSALTVVGFDKNESAGTYQLSEWQ